MRRKLLPLCAGILACFPRYRAVMVTLTLAPGAFWEPRMLSDYLKAVREWARRLGVEVPYVWVAELQEKRAARTGEGSRAVVHWHVLFFLPPGITMPKADKRGWWPHGATETARARKPVGYLSKYASKGQGLVFPRGLRLHGRGALGPVLKRFARWWSLPLYARAAFSPSEPVARGFGGIYSRESGLVAVSPFLVVWVRSDTGGKLFCLPRYPLDETAVDELCKRYVQVSRDNARAAGYSWVSV